jgi:TRAP-type uncharacterized transport system fused permease subunit
VIISTFLFIALGAMTIGVAFEGYFLRGLRIWENILLAICGICIFIPDFLTRGLALAFLAVFLFKHLIEARKTKTSTAPKPGSSHDKDNQYP